jgi:hypothetical protein
MLRGASGPAVAVRANVHEFFAKGRSEWRGTTSICHQDTSPVAPVGPQKAESGRQLRCFRVCDSVSATSRGMVFEGHTYIEVIGGQICCPEMRK